MPRPSQGETGEKVSKKVRVLDVGTGNDGEIVQKYPKEKIILGLPPSVNKAFTWNRNKHFLAHTNEYTAYLTENAYKVRSYCNRNRVSPISSFTPLYIYFYLFSKRSDSHNYKKALFDALEKGGLFENDKYILDRTMLVTYDKINPRIEILLNEL